MKNSKKLESLKNKMFETTNINAAIGGGNGYVIFYSAKYIPGQKLRVADNFKWLGPNQ